MRTRPRPVVPDPQREPFFLSVGYTYRHKNYEALIDAMALYRSRHPNGVGLKIIGGPDDSREYYDGLARRIAERGLQGKVEMLGPQPADVVVDHYRRARGYVVTSLLETFGLTTFEAMSHGTPVLVPDATCFPEVCDDAALYCDPYDVDDIADKIHRLNADAPLRDHLRRAGFERASQFTWERSAADFLEIIERCAA